MGKYGSLKMYILCSISPKIRKPFQAVYSLILKYCQRTCEYVDPT